MYHTGGQKSTFNPDSNIFKCQNREKWHEEIKYQIYYFTKNGRPVIVYFKSTKEIDGFKSVLNSNAKFNIINEKEEGREKSIREAAYHSYITLASREYGRGIDYVCYDDEIDKKGGVGVIQTFFSEDIKEELQIRGRTGR